MSTDNIARKSVAFFFLTSLANVTGMILFAALFLAGLLSGDPDPAPTYSFGAAALLATALVLTLPNWLRLSPSKHHAPAKHGRIAAARRFARSSLAQGVRDAVELLRRRSPGVLIGSFGATAFAIAVLGVCFLAIGHAPPLGVLTLGYLIGQLGGNIPVPGGVGGLDVGLVGTFVLYHQPLAASTAAVLLYDGISLWVPSVLGSVALVQLRHTLRRQVQAAILCLPLAEPIETGISPMPAGMGGQRG